jgi:hypothetical protein
VLSDGLLLQLSSLSAWETSSPEGKEKRIWVVPSRHAANPTRHSQFSTDHVNGSFQYDKLHKG